MKKQSLKLMMTAALVTLGATAVYGADKPLMVKIPFDFRAVQSNLPAGRYLIGPGPGNFNLTQLQNLDTGKTVFLTSKITRRDSDGRSRLVFNCCDACSLATLWPAEGVGQDFSTPGVSAQTERHKSINLMHVKGK